LSASAIRQGISVSASRWQLPQGRLAGSGPLFLVEGDVFRWLLFFVLILAGILAFVSFVMGIQIPGLSQFGIQQPSSPFEP